MNSLNHKNNGTGNKPTQTDILKGINVMCRLFWGPDIEICRQITANTFFTPFEILFSEDDPTNLDGMGLIVNGFETQSLHTHLNECYVRLFITDNNGIIPLYQSCYEFENAPMMGKSAIAMIDRFKSKGLSVENAVHEPPDHLAIELEYLFFLFQEETCENDEAVVFTKDILLPWVTVFNQRLEVTAEGDCPFYPLAARMLIQLLKLIARIHGAC